MPEHEGHGRNAGEAPDQVIHDVGALPGALVNRQDHRVDRALTDRADRLGYGAPVEDGKAPDACGIQSGPIGGSENRRHVAQPKIAATALQ